MRTSFYGSRFRADDPNVGASIVAVRYRSVDTRGWLWGSLSEGGYRSGSLLTYHPNCGGIVRAMGGDIAVVMYEANDSVSAAEYKNNINALCDFLTDNGFKLIALCSSTRGNAETPDHPVYAVKSWELAQQRDDCVFLNIRLLAERKYGWTNSNYVKWAPDGVHFNEAGGKAVADLIVNGLYDISAGKTRIYSFADTTVSQASPNSNASQNHQAACGIDAAGQRDVALLTFDSRALPPGAVIRSCRLSLHVDQLTGAAGQSLAIRHYARQWNESTETWNAAGGVMLHLGDVLHMGAFPTVSNHRYEFVLAGDGAIRSGELFSVALLAGNAEHAANLSFHTKEHVTPDQRPYLEIDFDVPSQAGRAAADDEQETSPARHKFSIGP